MYWNDDIFNRPVYTWTDKARPEDSPPLWVTLMFNSIYWSFNGWRVGETAIDVTSRMSSLQSTMSNVKPYLFMIFFFIARSNESLDSKRLLSPSDASREICGLSPFESDLCLPLTGLLSCHFIYQRLCRSMALSST